MSKSFHLLTFTISHNAPHGFTDFSLIKNELFYNHTLIVHLCQVIGFSVIMR